MPASRAPRAPQHDFFRAERPRFPYELAVVLLLAGCGGHLPWSAQPEPRCEQPVLLLEGAGEVHRRSERVARVSTQCTERPRCALQLRAYACEIRADAVILEPVRGPDPAYANTRSDEAHVIAPPARRGSEGQPRAPLASPTPASAFSQAGTAIRWLEPGHGAYAEQR